jgi:hypothetical protein
VSAIGGTGVSAIGGTGVNAIGGTGVSAIGGTGVNAIGGTGVNAIGGTGVNAIGGTGVNAIGGTGVSAIGGTGVNAIGGTGVNAIGGTGVNAIGGTGVNAIGGTGVSAIGGTGVNAIGGTGVSAIGGTGVNAIGGTGVNAIGGTGRAQVALLGPIDSVDQARRTITVLGRKLQLPTGEAGSRVLDSYLSGAPIQVAVLGSLSKSGKLSNLRVQVLQSPYVAGTSEIVLTGIVQAVDVSTGLAVIGGTAVNFTALLETQASALRVGSAVSVRGTMPQAGQAINASVIAIHGY